MSEVATGIATGSTTVGSAHCNSNRAQNVSIDDMRARSAKANRHAEELFEEEIFEEEAFQAMDTTVSATARYVRDTTRISAGILAAERNQATLFDHAVHMPKLLRQQMHQVQNAAISEGIVTAMRTLLQQARLMSQSVTCKRQWVPNAIHRATDATDLTLAQLHAEKQRATANQRELVKQLHAQIQHYGEVGNRLRSMTALNTLPLGHITEQQLSDLTTRLEDDSLRRHMTKVCHYTQTQSRLMS